MEVHIYIFSIGDKNRRQLILRRPKLAGSVCKGSIIILQAIIYTSIIISHKIHIHTFIRTKLGKLHLLWGQHEKGGWDGLKVLTIQATAEQLNLTTNFLEN